MARRSPRNPAPPPGNDAESRASWAPERHSGEGAASALALLQAQQKRRDAGRPAEPGTEAAERARPEA